MKIILQKSVSGLGDAGESKNVSDGYARNFLIPRKLAISAFQGSLKAQKHLERSIEIKTNKRKRSMEIISSKLQELGQIIIETNVGEEGKLYGSITNLNVMEHLKTLGFEIDRRKIEIKESIRQVGKYSICFNLADGVHQNLELHVSPNKQSIKKEEERIAKLEKQKERTDTKEHSNTSEEVNYESKSNLKEQSEDKDLEQMVKNSNNKSKTKGSDKTKKNK